MKVLNIVTKAFAVPVAAFLTFLGWILVWIAHINERRYSKRLRHRG